MNTHPALAGLVAAVSLAAAVPAAAAPETFVIDSAHTIPTFTVLHMGFTKQHGRFDKAEGRIAIDFAARKGSVEFTVYTGSLDMGENAWTEHLSSEGLFNVKNFPTMTYKSDHLIFDSDGHVVAAEGTLTMLGVAKPVLVTVNDFKCGTNPENHKYLCAGDVTADIKRSDFGLTKYLGAVGDDVKVEVPVEAYRQ